MIILQLKNPLKHLTDLKKLGSKILQPHMKIIIFKTNKNVQILGTMTL